MIVEAIRRFFSSRDIAPCRLIAACSGGIDSTALLLALVDLRGDGFEVICGHVNHHLRGAESDGDEAFVRQLCAGLEVPVEVADGTLDESEVRRVGIEAAARHVRHERLHEIARQHGARYVATAHQKNDQAETIIMRIVTGTGLAGLRGIHAVRDDGFIRPLLDVTREEIERFLDERAVTPRVDNSNANPRFLRNRIRTMLRDLGEAAVGNAAAVAAQAQQVWPTVEATIAEAEKRLLRMSDSETRFTGWPDDPWLRRAILHRQIRRLDPSARDISARDLERIASSLDSIRRVSVTRSLELLARHGRLVLRRVPGPTEDFEFILEPGGEIAIPATGAVVRLAICPEDSRIRGFEVSRSQGQSSNPRILESSHPDGSSNPRILESSHRDGSSNPRILASSNPDESSNARARQVFELPAGMSPAFTVRNRRRGDRFRPLGLTMDKKLKDFLIDRKIPAETRDSIPLLLCGGEIVWVGGVEISERFKVTSPAGVLYEVMLEHGSHEGSDEGVRS